MICLLHCNELLLRALFVYFDGKTTEPNTFSGPIGLAVCECLSALNIVTYEAIPFASAITLDDDVLNDLSNDQCYMYRIWQAIITEELALLEPGPLCHS